MENQRAILILAISCIVVLVLITGVHITGNAIDDGKGMLCETDSECIGTDVCCLFYQESAGVCAEKDKCIVITEITKNKNFNPENLAVENPKKDVHYYLENSLTTLFFILLTFLLALIITSKNISKKSLQQKKSSKKRKRK